MSKNIYVELDSNVYSRESISKCLYWYTNDFLIDIKFLKGVYQINLTPQKELSSEKINSIQIKLNRDFLDYNLREIVKNETHSIRELIMAKAFSNGEFDEEPKGDLMDPLGIKFL